VDIVNSGVLSLIDIKGELVKNVRWPTEECCGQNMKMVGGNKLEGKNAEVFLYPACCQDTNQQT
jgi:hypothetical protein